MSSLSDMVSINNQTCVVNEESFDNKSLYSQISTWTQKNPTESNLSKWKQKIEAKEKRLKAKEKWHLQQLN